AVLDSYENGRWTRRRRGSNDFVVLHTNAEQRLGTDTPQSSAVLVQQISFYEQPAEDSMVFAIQQPFLWEFNEPLEFLFDSRVGTLRLKQNAKTQSYVVHSGLPGPRASGDQAPAGL